MAKSHALRLVAPAAISHSPTANPNPNAKQNDLIVQRMSQSKFSPGDLLAVYKKTRDEEWLNKTILDSVIRAILELHRIGENDGMGELKRRSPSIALRVVLDIKKIKSADVHRFVASLVECIRTEALHESFHLLLRNCQRFCMTVLKDDRLRCVPQAMVYVPHVDDTLSRYTGYISQNKLLVEDMLDWMGWHSEGQTAAHLPPSLGLPIPDGATDTWFWLSAMTYCYTKTTYLAEDYELRRLRKGTQALVIHRHLFGKQTYYVPPGVVFCQGVMLLMPRAMFCVVCWRFRVTLFRCFILLLKSFGVLVYYFAITALLIALVCFGIVFICLVLCVFSFQRGIQRGNKK